MSENNNKMVWNVIYHNSNAKKIEFFNIFDHWRFSDEIDALLKKRKTREELEKEVNSLLKYYFWSKYEYEVLITSFPESEDRTIKVDVYWQVINNFDRFIDYLMSERKARRKAKRIAEMNEKE